MIAATPTLGRWLNQANWAIQPEAQTDVYVARNGTPITNVERVVTLAGGIQRFVDHDDAVVLKPNGQWANQGYTHTLCLKALIDVILNRPGGFAGEILIAEHVHRDPTETMAGQYCWNMPVGSRLNNWPDMNYMQLVSDYHSRGIPNVSAVPLYDSGTPNWKKVSSPADLGAAEQGWVHNAYSASANGRTVDLSYAIIRSPYSNKLIDLKNGVWQNGSYSGQKVKLIFLPTLNNHGGSVSNEDYAGPTSAVKTHIGFVDFGNLSGHSSLHGVGFDSPYSPAAFGESVGQLITQLIHPAFYMTCAEYTGYVNRTSSTAAHTKTVGLCADPVTLDYWMCKNVMYPCANQAFMQPDNDYNLRKTLLACHSKGVGTLTQAEISLHLSDLAVDRHVYLPAVRR
jgi:hypothetical protein